MGNKRRILLAALVVAVLVGLAWESLRPRGPVYGGKTLTAWLDEYIDEYSPSFGNHSNAQERQSLARTAIRQIGTNGLPILLKMARAKDSPLKTKLINLASKQSLVSIQFRTDEDYHRMACFGFYVLGSIGQDAVPALIDLLKENDPQTRPTAADCLGNIGPAAKAAVPVLIQYINDSNRIVRWDTTINLGRIHMEPALVVPILMTNLTVSNAILSTTIFALGQFGEQAKPAVPALLQFLNDDNQYVRSEATNSLQKIDPKAAAKAGIK
jgi:HEAT repeat protein